MNFFGSKFLTSYFFFQRVASFLPLLFSFSFRGVKIFEFLFLTASASKIFAP